MKRSEILLHIQEELRESLKHRFLEQGNVDNWTKYYSNELLDMLEGFGMLPPYRKRTQEEFNEIDAINQYHYVHKWEPEDEKK